MRSINSGIGQIHTGSFASGTALAVLSLALSLDAATAHAAPLPDEWPQAITANAFSAAVGNLVMPVTFVWNDAANGWKAWAGESEFLISGSALDALTLEAIGSGMGTAALDFSQQIGGTGAMVWDVNSYTWQFMFHDASGYRPDWLEDVQIRNVCIGFAAGLILHAWCWFAGSWARDFMRHYEALYR